MDVRICSLLFVFAGIAGPASAQMVYKCVDSRGDATYQSAPCPSQSSNEKAWAAPPDPEPSRSFVARQAAIGREIAARNAAARRTPAQSSRARLREPRSGNPCEAEKAARKAAYDRAGLKRTFEFSSHWDNRVWEACK